MRKSLENVVMKTFAFPFVVTFFALSSWAVPSLDGTWLKGCEDQDGDYVSSQLKINKAQWSFTHWGFEDEECNSKYLQFDRVYTVVLSGQNLDLKLVDAAYTPMTDEVAEALNEVSFCEISSWRKNRKTSIVGKQCGDVDNYIKNQMTYSIFKNENIDGKNQLSVGEASAAHSGESVEKRHVSLESTAYTK